jgi:hypothetical protein
MEDKVTQAILNGKKSVKVNGKTIELPTPQRCGTEYQKLTYAREAAKIIIGKL